MLELNFKPFPVLSTRRLNLVEITQNDAEEIFFLRSDKEVLRFLDRNPAGSVEEAIDWIKMINKVTTNNESIAWAIKPIGEKRVIGTINVWNIRKEHHRAEIGYVLHPEFQRQGLMHEALSSVLEYGFAQMKLHSVEANVNPANAASIGLLEKNKFIREAYHKENYYYNGNFHDSAIYSLISPIS